MDSKEKVFCFFFSSRRRHTRWNCDWSSDVCSSDLKAADEGLALLLGHRPEVDLDVGDLGEAVLQLGREDLLEERLEGAAGDREGQVHRDAGSLQVDAAHHVELDDAPVDLRIVDLGEDGADLVNGG